VAIVKDIKDIILDPGGRYYLPAKELANLSEKVMLVRRGEKILFLTKEEWDELEEKELKGLKGAVLRRKRRSLFSSISFEEIHTGNRLHIPSYLLEGGSN